MGVKSNIPLKINSAYIAVLKENFKVVPGVVSGVSHVSSDFDISYVADSYEEPSALLGDKHNGKKIVIGEKYLSPEMQKNILNEKNGFVPIKLSNTTKPIDLEQALYTCKTN